MNPRRFGFPRRRRGFVAFTARFLGLPVDLWLGMWLDNGMMTTEIHEMIRQHLAPKSDADLLEMLKLSDDRGVSFQIADELERRHPELTAAADAWADDLDTTDTYLDVVLRVLS